MSLRMQPFHPFLIQWFPSNQSLNQQAEARSWVSFLCMITFNRVSLDVVHHSCGLDHRWYIMLHVAGTVDRHQL